MAVPQTVKARVPRPVIYGVAQDLGRRPNQEDRWAVVEMTTADGCAATVALVADGIGGHNQGEVASGIAAASVPGRLAEQAPTASQVGECLRKAVEQAGREVYEASQLDEARDGMGTTCTSIAIVSEAGPGLRLYVAHVGDSRLYLLRKPGTGPGTGPGHGPATLCQLSIDHNWGEDALQAGFTPEEVRHHPNRGVLRRYLGIKPEVEVDMRYRSSTTGCTAGSPDTADSLAEPLALAAGDVLLLCTDGLADALNQAEIARILKLAAAGGAPGDAAASLVRRACQAGASDNLTAVVLRLHGQKRGLRAALCWVLGIS